MASCKVEWILSALALASCVLISTAASTEIGDKRVDVPTTIDELEMMLRTEEKLTPEEIEKLLNEYENKGDKIHLRTIGELNEICRLSLDKCSLDGLQAITAQTACYRRDNYGITKLYEYGNYCRTKLTDYCFDNINAVVENLLLNVTTEDDKLVASFRKSLLDAGVIDRAHSIYKDFQGDRKRAVEAGEEKVETMRNSAEIQKLVGEEEREETLEKYRKSAYDEVWGEAIRKVEGFKKEIDELISDKFSDEYRKRHSLEDQELFLYKFAQALEKYRKIFLFVWVISGGDESGSELNEGVKRDAFKFGRIGQRFNAVVGIEFFRKLQHQLRNKYAKPDEREWWDFLDGTEDQLKKVREQRERN